VKVDLSHYRRLLGELNVEDPAPVYLFRGPERFIMEEMAARLVASAVPEDMRSFNLTVSYGAEVELSTFLSAARSYPFLGPRRVLLLKELESLRGSWEGLVTYCRAPLPSSTVVFFFTTHDERGRAIRQPRDFKKLEKAVGAAGSVLQFHRLTEGGVRRWVMSKSKRMKVTLDDEAADALVRSVGENLFDIQNELQKLALLYEGGSVGLDDLTRVIGRYRMNAVFDLLGSIRPGSESAVLSTLSRILETGAEKPSAVLYHLIRHFLALLKVKAGFRGTGYRYDHLKRQSDLYGIDELLIWLENLRITELVMKSTVFPAEALIVGAILHSSRGKRLDVGAPAHAAA
jgi:DNA polymerase-3 subunit delta